MVLVDDFAKDVEVKADMVNTERKTREKGETTMAKAAKPLCGMI